MVRNALVTGVGRRRGIGAGIAAGLAADGWNLVLTFWHPYDERLGLEGRPEDPEQLASELRRGGARIELLPGDLENPSTPNRLVRDSVAQLGPLDALVMSHCESVASTILTTTVESLDRHYAVNVRAVWLLIASFAQQLSDQGGSVVALTSDHTVGNLAYGATKGALDRIVLAAAHELGERGVRANVINPGPIDTGWMDDSLRASAIEQQPTGRLGTPADVASLVRFLLSPSGQWINGQLLYSNGGFPKGHLPVQPKLLRAESNEPGCRCVRQRPGTCPLLVPNSAEPGCWERLTLSRCPWCMAYAPGGGALFAIMDHVKMPRTYQGLWALIAGPTLVLSAAAVVIVAYATGGGGALLRQRVEAIGVIGLAGSFLLITAMLTAAVHWKSRQE